MNFLCRTSRQLFNRLIPRGVLLFAVGLLAILAPVSTEVAHADPGYAYYWSLTFDFENNFDGTLHIEVGVNENGGVQQPALYSENFNVPCKRVGQVALTGGSAKFSGGYLQCDLDLKSALTAAFAKCQQVHPGCTMTIHEVEPYRNFRMLAGVISNVVGSAPLFYHEDAVFTILPDTGTTQVASTLTPIGPLTSLPTAAPLNTPQFYAAEYECDGGAGCANYFTVTGAMQSTSLPVQTVQFSTPVTNVYIGYNRATGATIPAGTELLSLVVDPPNFGNH